MAALLATEAPWALLKQSAAVARLLEKESQGAVSWLEAPTERDAYFVLWPRDAFCDWDEFIATTDSPGMRAFASGFGKSTFTDEALSEGGMFVRTSEHLLFSSASIKSCALPLNFRAHELPHPYSSDLFRRHQPEAEPLTHIDLDVALIPGDAKPLLLVSERYYSAYRASVARAVYHLGLEVAEIPQEEADRRGLNLVVLDEKAVLIPDGCPQLSGLLADRLGSESVIEVQIDSAFNYNRGRGGLGCMSNVVRTCSVPA